MKTCKDCKHWHGGESGQLDDLRYACSSLKFTGSYRLTHLIIEDGVRKEHPEVASDEVIVESDEGWDFSPGPDFGCLHHEAK